MSSEEMEAVVKELDAAMANQFTFAFWSGLRTGELIALVVCVKLCKKGIGYSVDRYALSVTRRA